MPHPARAEIFRPLGQEDRLSTLGAFVHGTRVHGARIDIARRSVAWGAGLQLRRIEIEGLEFHVVASRQRPWFLRLCFSLLLFVWCFLLLLFLFVFCLFFLCVFLPLVASVFCSVCCLRSPTPRGGAYLLLSVSKAALLT